VRPPDFDAHNRYPLIITTYSSRGFLRGGVGDEYPIQVLAAQGFVVLDFDSPVDWQFQKRAPTWEVVAQHERREGRDKKAVLSSLNSAIDLLLARGYIDPEKIGICGLSFGAEIALYAISHSRTFAAAAVSQAASDPDLYYLGGPELQRLLGSWG